jgi:hypothetical protein
MGYIERSPVPNPKMNPQFRIRYKKAEVKPPTKKQVEKILAIATGQVRLAETQPPTRLLTRSAT